MFFEEQYNELRSDHGLKEKDFFECNQQASTPMHLPTSPAAVECSRTHEVRTRPCGGDCVRYNLLT